MKKSAVMLVSAAVCTAAAGFLAYEDNHIDVEYSEIVSKKLGAGNRIRILHVSDFHNKRFPDGGERLFKTARETKPDFVFITGDLIDKRRTVQEDLHVALRFAKCLAETAPVYYIPGNHEAVSPLYPELRDKLLSYGFAVLENSTAPLEGHENISVSGVLDYDFYEKNHVVFHNKLKKTLDGADGELKILLSHRPQKLDEYAFCGADIVFCGHAHGGQVRLPFIGGLYAPQQGVFPKYTEGIHREGETVMTVSRGMGNSRCPIRVFNHPQLSVVELAGSEK